MTRILQHPSTFQGYLILWIIILLPAVLLAVLIYRLAFGAYYWLRPTFKVLIAHARR